jgi:GNAT superfamily N-acetyltransferase
MTWELDRKLRAAIHGPVGPMATRADTRVVEREGWFQRITPSSANHNEVLRSAVEEADAERVIDEVVAQYRALGKPTRWFTGPWTRPADFGDRLLRRGFRRSETRGMGCDTDAAVARGDTRVHRVETDADLDAYLHASRIAWAIDESDLEATRASYRARLGTLLVLFIAEGAGTGAVLLRDDYGYFVGGAVAESARGRGVYRALVAARLAFLRDRGIEYAVTHAREATSAPMLEHIGFETLFRGACYELDP